MPKLPSSVTRFLAGRRYAVAGVSRRPDQAANAIYRRLLACGFEVVPVNPRANEVEGVPCYPDVASVPGRLDGVMVVTSPEAALQIVHQCADKAVPGVWLHRSFGSGSVSREAVEACRERGIHCVVGGCPMMYCEPVDAGHRCMRWGLRLAGRVPA